MDSAIPENSQLGLVSDMVPDDHSRNGGIPSSQIPGTAAHALIKRSKQRVPLRAAGAPELIPSDEQMQGVEERLIDNSAAPDISQ